LQCEAYALWDELQAEAGTELVTRTGGVNIAPADSDNIRALIAACTACGVPHEVLSSAQAEARFGLTIPRDHVVLTQDDTVRLG
jgi:sarcosine oxidase